MNRFPFQLSLLSLLAVATSPNTYAFDPSTDASQAPSHATYQRLPDSVVPPRYYHNATAAAPIANPSPILAETPSYATPPSAPYVAPAPVYTPPVAVAEVTPAPAANVVRAPESYAPPQHSTSPSDRFTFGIEGFYDEYQEDSVSLVDKGYFAGLNASYEHTFGSDWCGEIDVRAARGTTDYESVSGTIDDIGQWDMEARLLMGYAPTYYQQGRTKLYTGLGSRYFSDELKGKVASLGGSGYDRRIFQLYLPIGITYDFAAFGLTFTPNMEYDHLLWGNVSSRLGTLGGAFRNIENKQTEGYGLRGELMMGQVDARGKGWQFGPFVRYWDIPNSDADGGFIEPENTRLQAGAKMKFLF